MMILAEASSGRSDFVSSSLTNSERPGFSAAPIFSIVAEPPWPAAGKAVVRTVMTFFASVDFTVWMALPA